MARNELRERAGLDPEQKTDGYTPPDKAKAMLIKPDVKYFVDMMTDEQAGILFKALFSFFIDGVQLKTKDSIVMATFNQCRDSIIDNNNRYRQTCIQNRKNRMGCQYVRG